MRCRICKKKFDSAYGRKTCEKCLTVRLLCACGCGKRARAIGDSGWPVLIRYVHGHNSRGTSRDSAPYLKMWANMSAKKRKERARKIGKSQKKIWAKMSLAEKEYRAIASIPKARPNKAEQKLNEILAQNFPKEFKLNVNAGFVLDGKVPDFVNVNGKKIVVELFGRYWHKPKEEAERMKAFAGYGFRTLVVWEDELKDEKALVGRLQKFVEKEK